MISMDRGSKFAKRGSLPAADLPRTWVAVRDEVPVLDRVFAVDDPVGHGPDAAVAGLEEGDVPDLRYARIIYSHLEQTIRGDPGRENPAGIPRVAELALVKRSALLCYVGYVTI